MLALCAMTILLPLVLGAKDSFENPAHSAAVSRPGSQGRSHHHMRGQRPLIADTDRGLVQAAMRDLRTGAVVVVEEDEAFALLPRTHARTGFIHFFGPRPNRTTALPGAPWMDASKVVSGGNTVAQVYPLGWGY